MDLLREKRRLLPLGCCQWDIGSDAPDMSGANAAALAQAELSKEQLAWIKQVYAEEAPARAAASARANTVSDAQLDSMRQADSLARDYTDYNRKTFRPLEQQIVADANAFDTEARREQEAGMAAADVAQRFGLARATLGREQARMGIDPRSGAAAAMSGDLVAQEALAGAAAKTGARRQMTTLAAARKMDAASLGRNLPANQATSAGLALNAGNSSASNALNSLTPSNQANSQMMAGFGQTQQGLASATQAQIGIANASRPQDSGLWSALGNVAGGFAGSKAGSTLIAGWLSDEDAKTGKQKIDPKASLASLRKIPVSSWSYKPGEGDGGEHVGPMAQDVQRELGDETAPGGREIDGISLAGHMLNGIKDLDSRLQTLESARRPPKRDKPAPVTLASATATPAIAQSRP